MAWSRLLVGFFALFLCSNAWAQVDEKVIETLVYEAGGGLEGMTAVAEVIRNRAQGSCPEIPTSNSCYEAVVMSPNQFSCWNDFSKLRTITPGEYQRASEAWELSRTSNLVHGARHYHASYCRPFWASSSPFIVRVGKHLFYE